MIENNIIEVLKKYAEPYEDIEHAIIYNSKFKDIARKLVLIEDITIDIGEIRKLPDGSIEDPEVIRQIALYGIRMNDGSLDSKIRKGFEFAGLYPENIKKYDITTEEFKKHIMKELQEKKKNEKI